MSKWVVIFLMALLATETMAQITPQQILNEVLETARNIKDPWKRAWALGEVALALAKAGMREKAVEASKEALQAARSIEDPFGRALALGHIALVLAKTGIKIKG